MFRGERGERGRAGDHGQDGRDGRDSDVEFEKQVADALAQALGERRLRLTDRRLLALYVLFCAALILMFWTLDRQFEVYRAAATKVCQQNNTGNRNVNQLLERLAQSAMANTSRTPAENAKAAETYRGLRLPISDCP